MPSDKPEIITAYDSYITNSSQTLPGKDVDMSPLAEHTRVERWTREGKPYLEEYRGCGKLEGKAAIVTGGDSGIGRSVSVFFAREGADVTIVYLPVEEEDAQMTKKLVEQAGRKALLVAGDLRSEEFRKKVIEHHLEAFKFIDVLVNNASQQIQCKDLAEIDIKNVEETFQANIIQMIGLAKLAIPHLKRGSSIINTSSVTAYKGSAGMVDYSATKGAITTFTRSLAMQLMPKGIRVNSVAPGPVYTPLQPASRSGEQMEGWGLGEIPLHGRVGQPAELGESFVYLVTSNLSTGTVVHPNSGQFFVPHLQLGRLSDLAPARLDALVDSLPLPMALPTSYSFSSTPLSHTPAIAHALLTHPGIYWGKNRTFEVIRRQVERAWRCVCVVRATAGGEEELAGFCRIISDGEGFGYLADLFIMPEHQKKGLARAMIHEAVENTGGEGASSGWKWFLFTKDGHELYKHVGFVRSEDVGWAMVKIPEASWMHQPSS